MNRETVELAAKNLMEMGIEFMLFETRDYSRESSFLTDVVEAGLRYKFPDSEWDVEIITSSTHDHPISYYCSVGEAPVENVYIEVKVMPFE